MRKIFLWKNYKGLAVVRVFDQFSKVIIVAILYPLSISKKISVHNLLITGEHSHEIKANYNYYNTRLHSHKIEVNQSLTINYAIPFNKWERNQKLTPKPIFYTTRIYIFRGGKKPASKHLFPSGNKALENNRRKKEF